MSYPLIARLEMHHESAVHPQRSHLQNLSGRQLGLEVIRTIYHWDSLHETEILYGR
ncbi:MAG: hypothetical protein HN867_13640 [Deltaproteobacteria bacterium]|nr:hypothetical protein [Deltaproteobacteria bacterium]